MRLNPLPFPLVLARRYFSVQKPNAKSVVQGVQLCSVRHTVGFKPQPVDLCVAVIGELEIVGREPERCLVGIRIPPETHGQRRLRHYGSRHAWMIEQRDGDWPGHAVTDETDMLGAVPLSYLPYYATEPIDDGRTAMGRDSPFAARENSPRPRNQYADNPLISENFPFSPNNSGT